MKSINEYKVSIIIPTFRRSKYIDRAINSVLNQSHKNIEIIVVDDNLPNSEFRKKTEEKMKKYIKSNFIYIKNIKNIGGALSRNEGIYKATGDFITFLDDDDIYLLDKVKHQLEFIIKNQYDLIFTEVRIHDTHDKLVDYREHQYITNFSNEELLKHHIMHHLTPTSTYMFDTKTIQRIGGFDDVDVGQEFMLMLKSIESNLKIGYLRNADVIQYLHDGERISVGQNKIDKEAELYKFKKKYFNKLTSKERRFVKFRYHAVMAVVGMRSGNIKFSVFNLLLAILTSPINSLKEMFNHIKKITKHRSYQKYR